MVDNSKKLIKEVDKLLIQLGVEPPKDENEKKEEFHVDPWNIEGKVDYEKLIIKFGCQKVTNKMLQKYEKLTGCKPHAMIRRGLYYAHRDFDKILDLYENGKPFYLYTGRGPSSGSMHLGHMVPFLINKHIQQAFNVPMVIQITDDEKYFWKNMSLKDAHYYARENAKDIIAMGFDITKTFIFIDTDYINYLYPNVCKIQNKTTFNSLKSLFGFNDDSINCGKISYPAIQVAPAFPTTFPIPLKNRKDINCLIPCAIDQDPYFKMTRDVAPKLGENKCSTLYSKFICGLGGPKGKMSSSIPNSVIFLSDKPDEIREKIMKHAFSGAAKTLSEHKKYGANLEIDVAYQYLTFFMDDDNELNKIGKLYSTGKIGSFDVKKKLCDVLIPIIETFQKNRKLVTDQVLDSFLAVRPLDF